MLTIIWASTNGGAPLADPVIHGTNLTQSSTTTPQTIFLSHNGVNPITACSLYASPFATGSLDPVTDYANAGGDHTRTDDFDELLDWGNAALAADWGGMMINQNATGSFPVASWPTFTNKTTVDTYGDNIRSNAPNHGADATNSIPLLTGPGGVAGTAVNAGEVPAGASPNVRFQVRFQIPSSASTSGVHLVDSILKYTFTS